VVKPASLANRLPAVRSSKSRQRKDIWYEDFLRTILQPEHCCQYGGGYVRTAVMERKFHHMMADALETFLGGL
jgi:hypothetical protein